MSQKRLGIFGGTFDPPHVGHLILSAEARNQLELQSTIWVLTPDPPHKRGQDISSLEHRLAMVQLAIEEDDAFSLSKVDIERPGPHYAIDTVRIMKQSYPDHVLIYLMGGDSLADLANWYHAQEFLNMVDGIGVMRRPGDDIDLTELIDTLPELPQKLNFVTAPLLEISSQQIRQRVRQDRAFRYYLLPKIYHYIKTHQIYQ